MRFKKGSIPWNKGLVGWTKFFQSLLSDKYGYQYSENGEIVVEVQKCQSN